MNKGAFSTCLAIAFLVMTAVASPAEAAEKIYVIDFNDIVHGVSAEFILDGIAKAEEDGAALVVLQMQTPGGLVTSMEEIIQGILSSKVPVVGFVSPSGAKAASAGFYILMACDVAVMAPGTRTGAATPIMMGGGGGEGEDENMKTLLKKVRGDSKAFLRALINGRNRHPEVDREITLAKAQAAIDDSEAYSVSEALEFGMIDFAAGSIDEILRHLNGKPIQRFAVEGTDAETVTFIFASPEYINYKMNMRQQFLSYLSNPMIAMLLALLGALGLYIEFNNPGLILPGAVGAICLVLAAIAFQILTVNWAGLLLIAIGMVLFILEIKITSYGMLTVGGILCLILGGLMIFEGPIPELRLHLYQLLPMTIAFAVIITFLMRLVFRAQYGKVVTGEKGLIGEAGVFRNGKAFVHGEIWSVINPGGFVEGDPIVIEEVHGLKLKVKKGK